MINIMNNTPVKLIASTLPLYEKIEDLDISYTYCINTTDEDDEIGCISGNLLNGMKEPVSDNLLYIIE